MRENTEPILFCWSGGKDSAMALHVLRQQKEQSVAALLTTVTEGYERISMHGVRRALLLRQAEALCAAVREVLLPPGWGNAVFQTRNAVGLLSHKKKTCRRLTL